MANEQRRIELPLERVNLPAQGRLRDAQRLGRATDVPVLDDRQKILDLATVEGHGRGCHATPGIPFSYRINRPNAIAA
jgi:hypothetical protein